MNTQTNQRGQALILIVLGIVGLVALTALAIDAGNSFSDRRHAQNAADTAALAAALAKINSQNFTTAALDRAASNGYNNDGVNSTVTVNNPPIAGCNGTNGPYAGNDEYIQVIIRSTVDTFFAPIVGIDQLHNCVEAIARAKPITEEALFFGNAVVGLNPSTSNCGVDTGNSNSKTWDLTGGGMFSNGCVNHPNGTLNVPNDKCITAVGSVTHSGGGTHTCVQPNQTAKAYAYPADIAAMMPLNPCTGAITAGRYAGGGKVPTAGQTTFTNDVFCISDFSTLDAHIVLTNATLYVTDTSFDVKFNGSGNKGFFGTASTSGTYKGYYMIIALLSKAEADSCNQNVEFRGNGNLLAVGTILAPSTCWDYRGNSEGLSTHSQMIFYNFTSNGNAEIDIAYSADENASIPLPPVIELAK